MARRAARLPVERVLSARAQVQAAMRAYFARQRFVSVDTPALVNAPGTDVYLDPLRSDDGYLITSPEFHMKRLLAEGLQRIYQFAHVFRGGEQGHLHEREFLLLEWYRAPGSYRQVMADTEALVQCALRATGTSLRLETAQGVVDCKAPFTRITVKQAFSRYAGIADVSELAERDEDLYFELLVDKIEPALARAKKPIFLVDYPLSQAALARPCPRAPGYAERFELYLGGVELCNGYGELTDAKEQRARFRADNVRRKARGKPALPIDEQLLAALPKLPPCAGNALGFDRLMMLALGASNVADVMVFPRAQL